MSERTRLRLPLAAAALLLLTACGQQPPDGADSPAPGTSAVETSAPETSGPGSPPPGSPSDPDPQGRGVELEAADSPTVIVNKQRPLQPADHVPEPLVDIEGHHLREDAAAATAAMLRDMRAEGLTVGLTSAYRPYDEQVSTYRHWVELNGQDTADTVSARPGYSEHQTGLAMDLSDGGGCDLQACFAQTGAGRWAAQHAHEYGLVLRYPQGAQEVTGYTYEPWHYRYIGKDEAALLHEQGASTLEEFYGTGPAPDYR